MCLRDKTRQPYCHRFGNKPIIYSGVEIGRLIVRVPWLHPNVFEGVGMPLNGLRKNSPGIINAKKDKIVKGPIPLAL